MRVVRDELSGCVECLFYVANGDIPEDRPTLPVEIAEHLGLGPHDHVVVACVEGCDGWFSWSPCNVCGSQLGGDRHTFAVLR